MALDPKVKEAGKKLLLQYARAYEAVQKAYRTYRDPARALERRASVAKKMKEFEQKHEVTLDTGTGMVVPHFDD